MINKFLKKISLGACLMACSLYANASIIGLSLTMDESGSIGSTNWATQVAAYIAAIDNVIPTDGSVAVSVVKFDTSSQLVFAMRIIDSAQDLTDLKNAIQGITYNGGLTNVAGGINTAAADMAAFGYDKLIRAIIDVSTDGFYNEGGDPLPAAQAFVSAARAGTIDGEAAVNCIGIGNSANCGFIFGDDAFSESADTFGAFQTALERKLRRELEIPNVSEPGILALLSLSLLFVARRKVFNK